MVRLSRYGFDTEREPIPASAHATCAADAEPFTLGYHNERYGNPAARGATPE